MNLKKNNLKKIYGDASFRKFYRKYNKNYNSSIIVIATKEKEKNLLIYTAVNEIININTAFKICNMLVFEMLSRILYGVSWNKAKAPNDRT